MSFIKINLESKVTLKWYLRQLIKILVMKFASAWSKFNSNGKKYEILLPERKSSWEDSLNLMKNLNDSWGNQLRNEISEETIIFFKEENNESCWIKDIVKNWNEIIKKK